MEERCRAGEKRSNRQSKDPTNPFNQPCWKLHLFSTIKNKRLNWSCEFPGSKYPLRTSPFAVCRLMCRTATCKILFKCLAVPGVFLEILRNLSWTENIPISLNSTSMATIIPGLASACDAFAKSYLAQVFGLKNPSVKWDPPSRPATHATPPATTPRWVSGHGKFPHRWDWSSPIAWGCPVQFGPKLTNAGNPSSPIYPSKCSHICCVKLSNYMLSTIPSAWHCGPQCSGVHDLHKHCGVNVLSSWPFVLPWANAHPGDDYYHLVP